MKEGLAAATVRGSKGSVRDIVFLIRVLFEGKRAVPHSARHQEVFANQHSGFILNQHSLPRKPGTVRNLSGNAAEQAVCYTLRQLEATSQMYQSPAFSFFQQVLSESGRDSCVHAALRSVGAVNLANRSPTVDMRSLVDLEHANALCGVTAALADPKERLRDATLIAVWLLGIRELFASITGSNHVCSRQTHINGTLLLLHLRGDEQFSHPRGRYLFRTVLSAMVRTPRKVNTPSYSANRIQHWRPLFASEAPTQDYLLLESQVHKAAPVIPSASLKLRDFFHGVCQLRSRIKNLLSFAEDLSVGKRLQKAKSYLKTAARLEWKATGWCDILRWHPRQIYENSPPHSPPGTSSTAGTPFRLYYFEDSAGFFHWNRYFVARICLHASVLDVLEIIADHLHPDNIAERERQALTGYISLHTTLVQETIRDFLGTFDYAFGDVDEEACVRTVPTAATAAGLTSTKYRFVNGHTTLQIQPPLAYLTTLKHLGLGQRDAMLLAQERIRAEFSVR
ncbi:hypothetical protein PV04_08741 [Phialophora macrospora]|uniref:Uncharacterized protein n=1 Tax=Phialophora macrospora TaxID=1851006 RepID=A0A0D2F713_9EURO|nr:hypothetical protein PV04_08741 [Phialophora macrospora]